MLPVLLALVHRQGDILPDFPSGWYAVPGGGSATKTDRIPGAAPGGFAALGTSLASFPIEREMRLTVSLRAQSADVTARINSFAYDAGGKVLKMVSTPVPLEVGTWTEGRTTMVAPRGTKTVTVFVLNMTPQPVEMRSPHLELGEARVLDVQGGGLLRASAGMPVAGGAGTVVFPIPGPTAEQVPVSFVLRSSDPAALKGYVVKRREGENWVCEAQVDPHGEKPTTLRWESLIAVRDRAVAPLPEAKLGVPDPSIKAWLVSTPVVQADDFAIRKKAAELRAGTADVETFVRRVLAFTSENKGTGGTFRSLDASCALTSGGSCTSRANLGAALLRAGGVPARTVSHLPTWAYGSGLYEHWLVEYWHPGVGWVRGETTQGEFRPEASGFAQLAVASIEDERRSGKPGQLGWIMPGAAWMSGIQGFGGLHAAGSENEGNANWCRPERRMDVMATMKAARAAWPRLAMGHPELNEVAAKATPTELAKALGSL